MIDWERVNELHAEIGADDFDEVVKLFLEEADEVAKALPQPMDAAALEAALHFLKGSALNLGFRDLASLCQRGEKSAAMGDVAAVDTAIVIDIYQRSKAAFIKGRRAMRAA